MTRQELVGDVGREVIGLILGYARTSRPVMNLPAQPAEPEEAPLSPP